jgi:hypothetical protein
MVGAWIIAIAFRIGDDMSFGDLLTPGSQLHVHGRARQGDIPSRRASRRAPPYGTKDDATRVIPVKDQGPIEGDNDQRKERLRLSFGRGSARDRNRERESRHQGEMVTKLGQDLFADIERASLMAKKAELVCIKSVLQDQLVTAHARALGLSSDEQKYFPPQLLQQLHEQHQQQKHQQAVVELNKQTNGEFWSSWLAAAQSGTRLNP